METVHPWATAIAANLSAWYKRDSRVLVAQNVPWYPVAADRSVCMTPDVLVALGRLSYPRSVYEQWEENDTAPQVVFEVVSADNRQLAPMVDRLHFCLHYGVRECYLFDARRETISAVVNGASGFQVAPQNREWISPLLGIRFVPEPGGYDGRHALRRVFLPSGEPLDRMPPASQPH